MLTTNDNKNTTIQLGNGYSVPTNEVMKSELYGGMMSVCDDIDCLPVTDAVSEFAVQDYVNFLNQKANKTKQQLKSCLQHCSLLGDKDYLWYNVKQLLAMSILNQKDILEGLNDNLLRDIYLHFPLPLIPDVYRDDDKFIREWDINLLLLKVEAFTIDGNTQISHIIQRSRNGLPSGITCTCSDPNLLLPFIQWHDNGLRKYQCTMLLLGKGKNGLEKEWYETGVLMSQIHFINNQYDGELITYYPNGKVKEYCKYASTHTGSLYQSYYDNGGKHTECTCLRYIAHTHLRNGQYTIWYRSDVEDCTGHIELQTNITNNIIGGNYTLYYPSGNKHKQHNRDRGIATIWCDYINPATGLQAVDLVSKRDFHIDPSKY